MLAPSSSAERFVEVSTEEVLDEVDTDQSDFPALCSMALGQVLLFERMIEEEFKIHSSKPKVRRLAQSPTRKELSDFSQL